MSSGKSYLTEWQRRALEATARGEVKRSYVAEGSRLKCPAISSATLWFLLRTNFITDGPREGGITTMILTKKGERFLAPPSQDVDQLIALAKAPFWRRGGDAAKLTSAQTASAGGDAARHGDPYSHQEGRQVLLSNGRG